MYDDFSTRLEQWLSERKGSGYNLIQALSRTQFGVLKHIRARRGLLEPKNGNEPIDDAYDA